MTFIRSLFASNESDADSVLFIGILAAVALVVFEAYSIFLAHTAFDMRGFAESMGIVATLTGGARKLRDTTLLERRPADQSSQ